MKYSGFHTRAFDDMLRNPMGGVPLDVYPKVNDYLNLREQDVVDLVNSLNNGDFGKIKSIGHSLKKSGESFGFPVISEIGHRLEAAAFEKDRKKLIVLIKHMSNVTRYLKRRVYEIYDRGFQ